MVDGNSELPLLPQHAALLAASAIDAEVARERGYASITAPIDLGRRGFKERQRNVPALLVPVWDVRGQIGLYQARPDTPRRDAKCKPIKYETPEGARTCLDVPPRVRHLLDDPRAPLWITEGVRKADAGASAGLCIIDLLGVWNFRGTNEFGGKTALADWEHIALNRREVIVCFDSDAMVKREVHAALVRLRDFLALHGARVRFAYLPPDSRGGKQGLDDFFGAGHSVEELLTLVSDTLRPPAPPDAAGDGDPLEVPPFPIGALPEPARTFVHEGAAALDVPPEFIGVPLLGFAGGTIGKRYCLELKAGYRQWPILYVAVVGAPGSGKSPAASLARHAVDRLQREAWQRFRDGMAAYRREVQAWEKTPPTERDERPTPPALAHYYTTDATIESLAFALTTSPGLTNFRDELVSWVKACDQYRGGKGGDRQRWLGGWSKDPWKVDRKKAEPLYIPDPVVCVVGGIQPDVLPELAHEAGARDGFIERILWCYPPERFPDDTDETVSEETLERMYEVFDKLRPVHDEAPDADSIAITLSDDARTLWKGWRRDNTRLLRETSGLAQGISAKLPDQAARLALILHCLKHPDQPESRRVSPATMGAAIDLVEFFRLSAFRVLPRFGQHGASSEGSLVAKVAAILDDAGGAWVSRSAIRDALHRNPSAQAITEALTRLEEQGRAEPRFNRDGRTGRPPEEWRSLANDLTREPRVNLRLFGDDEEEQIEVRA